MGRGREKAGWINTCEISSAHVAHACIGIMWVGELPRTSSLPTTTKCTHLRLFGGCKLPSLGRASCQLPCFGVCSLLSCLQNKLQGCLKGKFVLVSAFLRQMGQTPSLAKYTGRALLLLYFLTSVPSIRPGTHVPLLEYIHGS